MKPAILTLTALTLTACMGSEVGTRTETVTVSKATTASACGNFTGVSAQYAHNLDGLPFRCGPQTVLPVTYK